MTRLRRGNLVWGALLLIGIFAGSSGFSWGKVLTIGVALPLGIFAIAKSADKLGFSETSERSESPHNCPLCESENLFSRPVSESQFSDRLIASESFEYNCRDCDFEGFGPGPDVDIEDPSVGLLDRLKYKYV